MQELLDSDFAGIKEKTHALCMKHEGLAAASAAILNDNSTLAPRGDLPRSGSISMTMNGTMIRRPKEPTADQSCNTPTIEKTTSRPNVFCFHEDAPKLPFGSLLSY